MYLKDIDLEVVDSIELLSTRIQWQASVNTSKSLGPIKGQEFIYRVSKYQILIEDCDPCNCLVNRLVGWLFSCHFYRRVKLGIIGCIT
jgi:hypothetical protein